MRGAAAKVITLLAAALLLAPAAHAAWTLTGRGNAASYAKTLGTAAAPKLSATGKKITLTWTATSFLEGGAAPAYLIRRYDANSGAQQIVGAGCSGTITALACTETSVPTGTWQYTVTAAAGNWRGSESTKSASIKV